MGEESLNRLSAEPVLSVMRSFASLRMTAKDSEQQFAVNRHSQMQFHTFKRALVCNLRRARSDIEHIVRLGGWESPDMVLRYTRSVKFEDSLRLCLQKQYICYIVFT